MDEGGGWYLAKSFLGKERRSKGVVQKANIHSCFGRLEWLDWGILGFVRGGMEDGGNGSVVPCVTILGQKEKVRKIRS